MAYKEAHVFCPLVVHGSGGRQTCTFVVMETTERQDPSLGGEDPLEKGMATRSSILTGESHGQRSLAGYSPWGRKESDMTEAT